MVRKANRLAECPEPAPPVAESIAPVMGLPVTDPDAPEGIVTLKVVRPAHNQRLVHCVKADGTPVLLQVRNNATWGPPLEVQAQRADFREDLYAVVGERAGRDPRTRGRWKRGARLTNVTKRKKVALVNREDLSDVVAIADSEQYYRGCEAALRGFGIVLPWGGEEPITWTPI